MELVEGSIRFALPLYCFVLAAVAFYRVGITNIALDGMVALGSVVYVWSLNTTNPPVALLVTLAVTTVLCVIVVVSQVKLRLDVMLVTLGLLYVCNGLAQFISYATTGNAGYAVIAVDRQLPDGLIGPSIVALGIITWIALQKLRPLRLAKLLEDSPELARLQGMNIAKWSLIHAFIAALFLALATVALTEHGGAFSTGISGERGFLVLALVAAAGHSAGYAFLLATFFAISQKLLGFQGAVPIQIAEALTFVFAIVLVVVSSRKVMRTNPERLW